MNYLSRLPHLKNIRHVKSDDDVVVSLNGRPLSAHGDGLGSGDLGYRMLRLLLRSRLTRFGFRWIHPDLGASIADRVSGTEERGPHHTDRNKKRGEFLEAWAREQLAADPELGIVALGHTHLPTVLEVEPGRFYVNSGDWVRNRTYVTIGTDGIPTMQEWAG